MINIEDIEKKFIMEHSVAGQIKIEENEEKTPQEVSENNEEQPFNETCDDQDYENETYAVPEIEEAPEAFEKFSIPLFDKNAWDDSALIRAWDESIRQRDNVPEGPTFNEAPVCKVKVSRVQVDESFDEVRAPTYDRFKKPQIDSKRSRASNAVKNKTKKSRSEDYSKELPEQHHNVWEASAQPSTTHDTGSQSQAMPFVPPSSMLPSQDDDLNNLVNAWYFAGYYSAIYQMKNKEKQ